VCWTSIKNKNKNKVGAPHYAALILDELFLKGQACLQPAACKEWAAQQKQF
jgi:hypothetical protein